MKKFVKRYILSSIILFVICIVFTGWLHIDGFTLLKTNEAFRNLTLKISIFSSLFFSLITCFFISIAELSRKTYNKLEEYEKEAIEANDEDTLWNVFEKIRNYKNSMQCFSIQHMREANDILSYIQGKLEK